jgi:hypothetical protein
VAGNSSERRPASPRKAGRDQIGTVAGITSESAVHGKDDTVVPYEQSTIIETALKKAGAKVELVTLTDEDHWLSRPQTRIAMLQAVIGFLEIHNPPDNAADGPRSR